jgi:hypothetical protein
MEQFLNLSWLVVALSLVCLWLPGGLVARTHRRTQLVALVMLIVILFPVVSVSDDLLAVQYAAEADFWLCRKHIVSSPNIISPPSEGLPQAFSTEISVTFTRHFMEDRRFTIAAVPCIEAIQNRPPPSA